MKTEKGVIESRLLEELAEEAARVVGRHDDATNNAKALTERVNGALRRTAHFFALFCEYSNAIAPETPRSYRIDVRTAYTNLRWNDAFVSTRNQDLASGALLDHVMFSVGLRAPEPVVITRRWDQLGALEEELRLLNLRALDDVKLTGAATQEWYEVRLAPNIPLTMKFHGNYDLGRIDVLSSNIDGFGIAAFEIEARDVTPSLLDGIGRFLIGRTNVLPPALRRMRDPIGVIKLIPTA